LVSRSTKLLSAAHFRGESKIRPGRKKFALQNCLKNIQWLEPELSFDISVGAKKRASIIHPSEADIRYFDRILLDSSLLDFFTDRLVVLALP